MCVMKLALFWLLSPHGIDAHMGQTYENCLLLKLTPLGILSWNNAKKLPLTQKINLLLWYLHTKPKFFRVTHPQSFKFRVGFILGKSTKKLRAQLDILSFLVLFPSKILLEVTLRKFGFVCRQHWLCKEPLSDVIKVAIKWTRLIFMMLI